MVHLDQTRSRERLLPCVGTPSEPPAGICTEEEHLLKYLLVALAALALTIVPAATAAPAGKLVKSSSASGQFAVTSISADVKRPRVLYGRATGAVDSATFVVSCSRGFAITSNSMTRSAAGTWKLPMMRGPNTCSVIASAGGTGKIRIEVRAA